MSAESSIILSLCFFAIFFIFGQLGIFPIKFGINKHFVLTNKTLISIVQLMSNIDVQMIKSYKKIIVLESFLFKLNHILSNKY